MARLNDKRQRLLQAADHLIYNNSFNQTTLALIAQEAQVPLGNVYYYFKTKEEILKAVLQIRANQMEGMFTEWQTLSTPLERLIAFTRYFAEREPEAVKAGCIFGSLSLELSKQDNVLARDAAAIMDRQLAWVSEQFKAMNNTSPLDSARQLFAWLQGTAILSCSLQDHELYQSQIKAIEQWLAKLT